MKLTIEEIAEVVYQIERARLKSLETDSSDWDQLSEDDKEYYRNEVKYFMKDGATAKEYCKKLTIETITKDWDNCMNTNVVFWKQLRVERKNQLYLTQYIVQTLMNI